MGIKDKMHIALITYDYVSEDFFGGVGVYMHELALVLVNRGCEVEIFCASRSNEMIFSEEQFWINRVESESFDDFREKVMPIFEKRHGQKPFDIIEAPEGLHPSYQIRKAFPQIPHLIKLHGGYYTIRHTISKLPWWRKLRFILGAWRRGKRYTAYWSYDPYEDVEYKLALSCPYLTTPSRVMVKHVRENWDLPNHQIKTIPNPLRPNDQFLQIPIKKRESGKLKILYLSRLEEAKGIFELAKIIPVICKKYPQVEFLLVGKLVPSTFGRDISNYLDRKIKKFKESVHIYGKVPYEQVPNFLEQADICVFPSRFESFGYACLEAMAAGRAIIGSCHGGIGELLAGNCGIVIDPYDTKSFVKAVGKLVTDVDLRMKLGQNAREKAVQNYCSDVVGKMTEDYYKFVISNWEPSELI